MKMRISIAAALFIVGCTHTPDTPDQVYICEAAYEGEAGRFSATKYLNLDGEQRRWPAAEDSELRWVLNADDGSVLASFVSQPWAPDAYNHAGKVSLRVPWSEPLPVGTRIFLDIPGQGFAFEGFSVGEKSTSSGIYTDWPPFKSAIQGLSAANIVFTMPNGDIIRREPISLDIFHAADTHLQDIKAEADRLSENYETACRIETIEYIIVV